MTTFGSTTKEIHSNASLAATIVPSDVIITLRCALLPASHHRYLMTLFTSKCQHWHSSWRYNVSSAGIESIKTLAHVDLGCTNEHLIFAFAHVLAPSSSRTHHSDLDHGLEFAGMALRCKRLLPPPTSRMADWPTRDHLPRHRQHPHGLPRRTQRSRLVRLTHT